jgi:hypothetical protein
MIVESGGDHITAGGSLGKNTLGQKVHSCQLLSRLSLSRHTTRSLPENSDEQQGNAAGSSP